MTDSQKGIFYVALGAILFSAKAIFIKLAYSQFEVNDITLLTLRFGYSLPFFIGIAFWNFRKGKMSQLNRHNILFIAVLSMLGYYIASLFDFKGLQYVSAGIERIILFIYPTLVVIFSRVFLKKSISRTSLIALVICYTGIVIIAFDPHLFNSPDVVKGAGFIFISAITYSLYLTFGAEIVHRFGSINFNSLAMIFSCTYVILHFLAVEETNLSQLSLGLHAYGLLLAVISTVIPTFLVMEGVSLLGANKVAIIASIGPVSTIILGYYILGEKFTVQEAIGSLFILGGVILIGKAKD